MNHQSKNPRKSLYSNIIGFTLVELIVVITILAILGAIGFLAITGYSTSAALAAVKSNVRTALSAIVFEITKSGNSSRVYVSHSWTYALTGAFAFSGQSLVAWPTSNTSANYSAGPLNYTALNIDSSRFVSSDGSAMLWGAATITETLSSGRPRARSYVQVWGFSKGTWVVQWDYPGALISWDVSGLILDRSQASATGALIDGWTVWTVYVAPPSWTVAGGGDCTYVTNSLGNNLDTSVCTDPRTYTHSDGSATHDKTYSLIKISGRWWFNENLAYPAATGYRWSNSWATTDAGYYSCPTSTESSSTVDCTLVATKWYLYQWSSAMAGSASTNNQSARVQWVCPSGWAIPTKADFMTPWNAYWTESDGWWAGGNTTGWIPTFTGYRTNNAVGNIYGITNLNWLWASLEGSAGASGNAWYMDFRPYWVNIADRGLDLKSHGNSVRCINNGS